MLIVDFLIESHLFARKFNLNEDQRNLLWKIGSKFFLLNKKQKRSETNRSNFFRLSRQNQTKFNSTRNTKFCVCLSNSFSSLFRWKIRKFRRTNSTPFDQVRLFFSFYSNEKNPIWSILSEATRFSRWRIRSSSSCFPHSENLFFRLIQESVDYYLHLQSESHRDGWTNIFMLLFTKILKLNDEQVSGKRWRWNFSNDCRFFFFQFTSFSTELYLLLSQIVIYETKAELRYLLREYFLRIGHIFHIKRDWTVLSILYLLFHIPSFIFQRWFWDQSSIFRNKCNDFLLFRFFT